MNDSTGSVELSVRESTTDTVVVRVVGEVDMATAPTVMNSVHGYVSAPGRTLVLDLTEVTFFGSDGINVLLTLRSACRRTGAHLRVVANTPAVLHPLEVTGLIDHFVIASEVN